MPEVKSDAEIIAESREYIEQHGWVQGGLYAHDGRVCAMGGIIYSQDWYQASAESVVPEHSDDLHRVCVKIADALGLEPVLSNPSYPLVRFNDSDGTTKQMVLDAFAKAEKIERAGFDPDA